MASLTRRIMELARSPQGRRLIEQAKQQARDPENRRRLEQLRARYGKRR